MLDSAYQELLSPYNILSTDKEWASAAFTSNPYHPEHLVHKTVFNLFVRSKSESLIAIALAEKGIPFRYECELELSSLGLKRYPDFTLKHPLTGEIIYYEHFGMIDNPQYYTDFCQKIREYSTEGIILGKNLICTFETTDNPLSYSSVVHVLDSFFS